MRNNYKYRCTFEPAYTRACRLNCMHFTTFWYVASSLNMYNTSVYSMYDGFRKKCTGLPAIRLIPGPITTCHTYDRIEKL